MNKPEGKKTTIRCYLSAECHSAECLGANSGLVLICVILLIVIHMNVLVLSQQICH